MGLDARAHDIREKAAKEPVEAGGELEGPLGVGRIGASLLGNPHDEIDIGPEGTLEGGLGDAGRMEGLAEEVPVKLTPAWKIS